MYNVLEEKKSDFKEDIDMSFKIGFAVSSTENKPAEKTYDTPKQPAASRKSLVQVYFAGRNLTLSYYNDLFDLHPGDLVYVDGKLEGTRGRVADVSYNFKIKLSEYKRVIGVVDTDVHGKFYMAGSHFITFDRNVLPSYKIRTWFKAPETEEEEIVSGSDDTSFHLDDLKEMHVKPEIAERGHEYYLDNKVRYISVDGSKGYAVVEGSEAYEVEFEYQNGEIGGLTCSCFCSFNCKHEFAAMLQLRETLGLITERYADEYKLTEYFAAVNKGTLFGVAIDGKGTGEFVL